MVSPRDFAYSLFGGPLILDVGPTVNGEIIRVRVQPINTISVTALAISLLLFLSFMYFYLYPLFRNRRALAATSERARNTDVEQPAMQSIEEEKINLLSWLHFRSRDRFSTHNSSPKSPKSVSPVQTPPGLKRQPSSFTRGSLVPNLSPASLTPPPPAYASKPSSPLAMTDFRFPSPRSSPPSDASRIRSPRTPSLSLPSPALPASTLLGPATPHASPTPRVQFGAQMPSRPRTASPAIGRSRSGTGLPTSMLPVPSLMAPRRSVSASTLHPVNADLHVPSRARVYSATPGEEEAGASSVEGGSTAEGAASTGRRVARPKDGAGLGLGIGLAARGRILTRGPSSWNVDARGIGSSF
ncbi:hypothetical protein B0H15DRAFT_11921 [Mycena belliarum]|uniref:Uncharacterized protein n=1 Tax=Mycena belliarum TaxID=1033014 RepID=A0AAD6UN27_9AGAR|nr:hypothetical protein B0H15DRAFT_11921 [Mycena belliae]